MPSIATDIPCILPVPREQYLHKNEVRIRNAALPANNKDPLVAKHLTLLLYAEDLIDRHEVAAAAHRSSSPSREHIAITHDRYATMAKQHKLFHLDQLAHILL